MRCQWPIGFAAFLYLSASAFLFGRNLHPWHESLYQGGGGYWRCRIPLTVENLREQKIEGEVVEIRVGSVQGELNLAGAEGRALRICDDRGRELLFAWQRGDQSLMRQGTLQAGDVIAFPVHCELKGTSNYYIYCDNPQASPVDDFLKPPDRVINGGFESGAREPDEWTTGLAAPHRRLVWVADGGRSGRRCVRVEVDPGQEPSWVQWAQRGIPVTPGREYEFRAWVKASNVVGKAGWFVHVNGSRPQLLNRVLDGGSGTFDWREVVLRFTAPPESASATVGTVLYGTGLAWYDDASLTVVGDTPKAACRIHIGQKEVLALTHLSVNREWYAEAGCPTWEGRAPILVRNFGAKDLSHQLVCVDLIGTLKGLGRKINPESLRVVNPGGSGRIIPFLRMDNTIAFPADAPAMSERVFFLYFSRKGGFSAPPRMEYDDLVRSEANLLKDPDFEQEKGSPPAWNCTATHEGEKVLCVPGREKPGHTGNFCARLEVPPGSPLRWSGWRQSVPIEPGASYYYAGFLKTKDAEGGVTLHGHFRDAEHKLVKGQWGMSTRPPVTGTSDWTQTSAMFQPPGDARFFEAHLTSNVHGTVWHDSLVLCRILRGIAGAIEWSSVAGQEGPARADLAVWEVNPLVKVFREDLPEPFDGVIEVRLARNEYEPAQVVLRSAHDLKGVTVRTIPPRNAKGESLSEVVVNPIGYVPVDYPTNYYSSTLGEGYRLYPSAPPRSDGWAGDWPDPLRPNRPFDLRKDEAQPLWITVHAPLDAAPGEYEGKIILDLPGVGAREIPLHVTVWGFTVPETTRLRVLFDLSVGNIRRFDLRPDDKAILRQWYRFLAEHRVCPDRVRPEPKFAFKNGGVQFDPTEFDAMARYCLDELGMNSFYAPGLFYTFGWAYPPKKVFGLEPFTPEYDDALTKALSAFMDHLRQKGWDEKAIVYVSDEPHYRKPGVVENLAKYCQRIHKVPGARTYSSTWDYVPGLVGAVDIWGVGPHGSFPVERMKERLAAGDCLIFTTDGHMCIDTPYLAIERLLPYLCWKYGVSGYEFWGVCWWTYDPWERGWHKYIRQSSSPDEPPHHVRYPNGDGYLAYPGQPVGEEGPISSIRFEQVREGIEDYDYFSLLNSLVAEAKKNGLSTQEAERALARVGDLVAIPNKGGLRSADLMPNPDAVLAARAAVAQEILRLQERLRR